jgi:hypothetical protein
MGVRWNGSEEKSEEEGWQEEVTLVSYLRASLVASKLGVPGDARKTNSLRRIHFVPPFTFLVVSSLTDAASKGNLWT